MNATDHRVQVEGIMEFRGAAGFNLVNEGEMIKDAVTAWRNR